MFLSCFTNCYGPAGVRVAVEKIREAGINHLELALRGHNLGGLVIPESVVITEKADDVTASAFVDHLKRYEVRVSGCNVGGGDPATAEGRDLTIRRLRFAARWFGVSVVVSGAGRPQTNQERACVIENLQAIGEAAREAGLVVALETHGGPTQNADAMLQLMAEVDHPHIRLNFDTGNIAYYNRGLDPVAELERVKHLVANVHLKDNRGGFEDWFFPAAGEGGAVDFRAVKQALDSVNFTGACVIEIEGIGGEPEPGLEERHRRVAASVRHLRSCGFP